MTASAAEDRRKGTGPEESLDPDDWEAFRRIAHRMVDDTIDHLATLRDRPAWQPMPDEVRTSLREPLPIEPQGLEAAYQDYVDHVLPYPNGNQGPRFYGWVQGNGTPVGMMAEMLAAALNPHMAGFDQAPALVEHQVIAWLAEAMGFPVGSSGLLVAGGTMANLLGLAVARYARAGFDVRADGLQAQPRLRVYGSLETHGWARKAVELMGMGEHAFCRVPCDAAYRLDVGALREAIHRDRIDGHRPFCVIGTAGTVNTGATDDLEALATICREERLWFHIDGAFGALVRLSERLRPLVAGLELADSVAFDLHKWGYLPFGVACVLVRDPALHRDTFATTASYLAESTRGVIAGGLPFSDRGIDLTRDFKALKVWLSFKTHGIGKIARLIDQNVDQARYLAVQVEAHPALELLAPVPLNVVCFRYAPAGRRAKGDDAALNRLNSELLLRVQEAGIAVPSGTTLQGRYALRAAIVNHRSRREDFDALIEGVVRIGAELEAEGM